MKSALGKIVISYGVVVMTISKDIKLETRKRFTIAHELGIFIMKEVCKLMISFPILASVTIYLESIVETYAREMLMTLLLNY